jgi:hypothetical protein
MMPASVSCSSSPLAGRARPDVVQRWVHALASRQYHLMSSHQSAPSGVISLESKRIPHNQQEKTPTRRAPLPIPGSRRISPAMTSPPADQPRPATPPAGQAPKTIPARGWLDNRWWQDTSTRAQRPSIWQLEFCRLLNADT